MKRVFSFIHIESEGKGASSAQVGRAGQGRAWFEALRNLAHLALFDVDTLKSSCGQRFKK